MATENVKVITNIYNIYNLHEREVLLVFSKKKRRMYCSYGGMKYKLSALLYILYLTEIKYYVSM